MICAGMSSCMHHEMVFTSYLCNTNKLHEVPQVPDVTGSYLPDDSPQNSQDHDDWFEALAK